MNAYNGIKINKTVKDSPDMNSMFKTSKISDILNRPSSIDPFASLAGRSSYIRFIKDNQAEDQDKVKDELLKVKKELNKKNKELTELKIDFQKLEEDNNKNLKVIQDILSEFGKEIGENILAELTNNNTEKNIYNLNENFKELSNDNDEMERMEDDEKRINFMPESNKEINLKSKHENLKLNWKSYIRLRELFVINSLKKQVGSMKNILKQKDEEMEILKSNLKCAKYSKLEFNYNKNLNSFIKTKKDYENVKKIQTDTTDKLIKEKEENDKLYSSLNRYKIQFDEMKIKSKIIEDENKELLMRNKALEEKLNFMKNFTNPPSHYSKVSLRQKENLILGLKSELQASTEKYKAERQRLERRIYFLDKDFKRIKEVLEIKNDEKKDIEKNVNNLKEESRKFISNLQWMIKIEKELFLTEKKQLNEHIQSLKILIEKANKEHELKIEIPEFKLILPTSTCLQEINQHKLLKDLEKKFEETEKNLNSSLNNQERIKLLRQIELPKQEEQNNLELVANVHNDYQIEEAKKEKNTNYDLQIVNNFADFKIEPIKGKESFMLTALNRNKLVEENFLRDADNIENPCLSAENKENNKEEFESNKSKLKPLEKEELNPKPNDSSRLNIKDENNNPNTSVMNSSKLRLKNVIHCVVDAINSSRGSINLGSNNNKLKVPVGFDQLDNLNPNMIFNEDLKKEINEITNTAVNPDDDKATDFDVNKKEEENIIKNKDAVLRYDSDDALKNENDMEKFDNNKENEVITKDRITRIQFNEEKNEVVVDEKEEGNQNKKNDSENSIIDKRNEIKENQDKVELNLSKLSNKSNKNPSPKKKRSSCLKLRCNYVIKILESEEQVIDIYKPYYVANKDEENKETIKSRNSKSKSQIIKTETMKKMDTIEKIFTEGIQRNYNFEDLFSDPRISNLYNNEI